MRFTDTDRSLPGSTVRYAVRGLDPDGQPAQLHLGQRHRRRRRDRSATYGNAVLDDGATKFWRLDESAGDSSVCDWVGADDATAGTGVTRGAAGALTNSTDTASTFDGTANGVGRLPGADRRPEHLLSGGVVQDHVDATGGKIAGFGNGASGDSGSYDRHIYMNVTDRVYFGVYTGSAADDQLRRGARRRSVAPGRGQPWAPTGWPSTSTASASARRTDVTDGQAYTGYWRIGGDNIGGWPNQPSSYYFNGTIDDARSTRPH